MRKIYIGFSLSRCLLDILKKKIDIDNISAIVTSTAFDSIHMAFEAYYRLYWDQFPPDEVFKTLTSVWPIVCQPRLQSGLLNHRGHYGSVTWLDTLSGEVNVLPSEG